MGLSYRPRVQIKADGNDITALINQYFSEIRLTDNAGINSDSLSLTLVANDSLALPAAGAVLDIAIGFGDALTPRGKFVVDDVSESGPPRVISINASAAPFDSTKSPSAMQTQKTRSWDDVTLAALVQTIAGEHGLTPRVSAEFNAIHMPHIDQTGQSDLHFLSLLAAKYGAILKPAAGYLVFALEAQQKSATGQPLPSVSVNRNQCSRWDYRASSRNSAKAVVATYSDDATGQSGEVSLGQGEPAFKMAYTFTSKAEAEAAAKARLKTMATGSETLALTFPLTLALLAATPEGELTASGFSDKINGDWTIDSVGISVGRSGAVIDLNAKRGELKA